MPLEGRPDENPRVDRDSGGPSYAPTYGLVISSYAICIDEAYGFRRGGGDIVRPDESVVSPVVGVAYVLEKPPIPTVVNGAVVRLPTYDVRPEAIVPKVPEPTEDSVPCSCEYISSCVVRRGIWGTPEVSYF